MTPNPTVDLLRFAESDKIRVCGVVQNSSNDRFPAPLLT